MNRKSKSHTDTTKHKRKKNVYPKENRTTIWPKIEKRRKSSLRIKEEAPPRHHKNQELIGESNKT